MTDLILDMNAVPSHGHPLEQVSALGITYRTAHPHPIADRWVLKGCSNLPATLPDWLIDRGEIGIKGEE